MKVCVKNGEFSALWLSSLKLCSTNWNGMFSAIRCTHQTWYHLTKTISQLKCDLVGQHFTMEEDLQSVVAGFFTKQGAEWHSAGIHKLISCYNKRPDEQGDYVEKQEISQGVQWSTLFFTSFVNSVIVLLKRLS